MLGYFLLWAILKYFILFVLVYFSGKLKEAIDCLEKAIPLSKSEKELLHIFSLRDSAHAQLAIVDRLIITPPKVY